MESDPHALPATAFGRKSNAYAATALFDTVRAELRGEPGLLAGVGVPTRLAPRACTTDPGSLPCSEKP